MFISILLASKAVLSIIFLIRLNNAFPIEPYANHEVNFLMKRSPAVMHSYTSHSTPSSTTEPSSKIDTYHLKEWEEEQKGEKEKAFSSSNHVKSSRKVHLRPIKIEAHASSAPSSPVTYPLKKYISHLNAKVKHENQKLSEPRRLTSIKSESDLNRLTSRRHRLTFATDDQLMQTDRVDHARSNYPGISSSRNIYTLQTIETWHRPTNGKISAESVAHTSPTASPRHHGSQVMDKVSFCIGKVADCIRKGTGKIMSSADSQNAIGRRNPRRPKEFRRVSSFLSNA